MSFLLLFQPQESPPPPSIAGLEIGSSISVSCSLDLDAELFLVDISLDWSGADVAMDIFTNVLDLEFGVSSRSRIYLGEENQLNVSAWCGTDLSVRFDQESIFDILFDAGSDVFITFLEDKSAWFFDISASSRPVVGMTFARLKSVSSVPDSDKDTALRYIEFIV